MNPKINKPDTEYEYYRHDMVDIVKHSDGFQRKYFNEMEEYHEANPGVYFRNNVWWWRPLWEFVIDQCQDFMTKEQIKGGCFNDGQEINQKTAALIGAKLKISVIDGTVDKYAKSHEKERKAKDKDDFDSNYPFDTNNVKHFAEFCLQSGGFIIC